MARIDSVFNDLDLGSIDSVVCAYSYEPGTFALSSYDHIRVVGIESQAHDDEVRRALEAEGFTAEPEDTRRPELRRFTGEEDLTASISHLSFEEDGERFGDMSGWDCDVPKSGVTLVEISLPQQSTPGALAPGAQWSVAISR
ncbi:hypothetical protein IFT90_15410 [Frigoribacterium sp. CFBP 8766]|uniref:hypothetical protein n=1 Tax=Frigoribacterium sp. CFBP 8766 TaxID=2775273 RepID=UPI00177EB54B|nr:hypothetical protein [Frigoribacterium sp. CFBP 8766]MBD8585942.1 hypothetical protein [Frigoribacterium sp. CFBP 8766]